MSIALSCKCGQKFKAKDSLSGRKVKCPICSTVILVPQQAAQPAAEVGPAGREPVPDDPLGLGSDLSSPLSDPLASPAAPTATLPAGRSPYMSNRPQPKTPKKGGLSPLVLGLCIGGGVVVLLLVGGAVGMILLSGSGDDQAVADATPSAPATNKGTSAANAGASEASATENAQEPGGPAAAGAAETAAPDQGSDQPVDDSSGTEESADANRPEPAGEQADEPTAGPTPAEIARAEKQRLAAEKRRAANATPRVPELGVNKPPKEYCLALAEEYLLAVNDGSDVRMTEWIDWTTLLENASHGDHLKGDFRDIFIGTQIELVTMPGGFMSRLMKYVQEGGNYKLLRIHDVDGQRRGLFRLIRKGGFEYHDMIYEGDEDGGAVIFVDWFDYRSGERYSDYVRRSYLTSVAEADKSLLDGLPGWEGIFAKYVDDFRLMGQSARDQPEVTLDTFRNLDEEVRNEKRILWFRLIAASRIGNRDEFAKALADLKQHHPADPSVDMQLINHHVRREEPEKAIAAIDRIDKMVGGDPYLNVVRYDVHRATGDLRAARKYYNAALRKDPSLKKYLRPLGRGGRKTRDASFVREG